MTAPEKLSKIIPIPPLVGGYSKGHYSCLLHVKPEIYLLLTTHMHDGCLANPASIWNAGCARPQKCTLRKMQYALDQLGQCSGSIRQWDRVR